MKHRAGDDLTGLKIGHLTVLRRTKPRINNKGKAVRRWECECDCVEHNHVYIDESNLLYAETGKTNPSCGCGNGRKIADKLVKSHARFGRLTVIGLAKRIQVGKNLKAAVWCRCDCGNVIRCTVNTLTNNNTKSCGCLKIDRIREANTKHNMAYSRLYFIYHGMVDRCYNINNDNYPNYGGRGIHICDEWYTGDPSESFINFMTWAYANGYYDQPKDTPRAYRLSIDRIDNNGPYAPWNCRWADSYFIQANNTRKNKYIVDYGDIKLTVAQFERKYNLKSGYVTGKRFRNWDDDAIVYSAHNKDLELHRTTHKKEENYYVDKNGFRRLIPKRNAVGLIK